MHMTHASVTLYCTEGSADKQYMVTIVPAGDLFHVVCFNGRRGGPQKAQPKTKEPLSLVEAEKLYARIVAEKKRGGYTPDESGVPYALTEKAGEVSGWLPALLSAVEAVDVDRYMRDDAWAASEKYDGERRAVEIGPEELRGMNKKGLYAHVPESWTHILAGLPKNTVIDGEHVVGDILYVFDVVKLAGKDMTGLGFEAREQALLSLERLIGTHANGAVVIVRTERGEAGKRALLKKVELSLGEGVVFRRLDGTYRPGEAASAASAVQIKYKIQESATCVVSCVSNTKRSVSVAVLDEAGAEVDIGNVTIPANKTVPKVGDVIEVRFVCKFEGGCLFQPFYLGQRTDQERADAQLRKILRVKRKSAATAEEEEAEEA